MSDEKPTDLIDLQSAHVTQVSNKGVKGDWKVRKNITSEDIHTLPAHLSDHQVFGILNFARKYELIAFNEGIKLQKSRQNEYYVDKINELTKLTNEFAAENERLSTILETVLEQGD